jgi:hypothetical protein
MATQSRSTVVGVFATLEQAHQAVAELRRAGFSATQIALVMHRHHPGTVEVTDLDSAKAAPVTGHSKASAGAALGALTGGVLGGAMAAATALLPGVGPVLSLGTVAGTFFGVAGGAVGGGLVGALIGLDFPEEEARYYERQLKAGCILVGVKAEHQAAEAARILHDCGASDPGHGPGVPAETSPAPTEAAVRQ